MILGLVIVLLPMLHVVMKFNLGQDSEARFGQDFDDQVLWRGWCLVEILKMMLGRKSEDEIWSRFVFELFKWHLQVILVSWTQPSGPLCLWQCFLWAQQQRFHLQVDLSASDKRVENVIANKNSIIIYTYTTFLQKWWKPFRFCKQVSFWPRYRVIWK